MVQPNIHANKDLRYCESQQSWYVQVWSLVC